MRWGVYVNEGEKRKSPVSGGFSMEGEPENTWVSS